MRGLGIGLGMYRGQAPLVRTLAGLAAKSQIAGRDGSVACTRATARRCVFTGAVLGNNTACYGVFSLPGLGDVRFYLAEPQSTNRELYSDPRAADWLGSGVTKATAGAYARITEDTGNTSHRLLTSSTFTLTGLTTYTMSFIVGPLSTAPYVTATIGTTIITSRTVATCNLATGAIGGTTGSMSVLADGSKLVSFTFTTIASPAANSIPIGLSLTGAEVYVGVGNFADIKDVLLEASTIAGPRINTAGAPVTHDADQIDWTPPVALGSDCEVWGMYIPFAWSATAGGDLPGGAIPRMFAANSDAFRMYTQTNFSGERFDNTAVGRVSSSATIEARAHAVGMPFSLRTSGQYVTAFHGSQQAANSPAGVVPYAATTSLRLGNRFAGLDRALRGVLCLGVAPTITPAERAALQTIAATLPNLFLP